MAIILNLTQYPSTHEQKLAGVVEPEEKALVQALLTFDEMPVSLELTRRAEALAKIADSYGFKAAMIGGAPFFMSRLENALKAKGITPLYAFSKRESKETTKPDGTVVKTNVFRHLGFVEA
jgi:hypothetical protein